MRRIFLMRFLVFLILLNTVSIMSAITVKCDVDWKTFISRHNLLWDKTPDSYFNAPFVGNGLLGAMLYKPENYPVRLDIGHSGVLEHRQTEARSIVDNGRLPIGYFELASTYQPIEMEGKLDIYDAEASFDARTNKGKSFTIRLKAFRNVDLISVDVTPSAGLNTYWIFRPIPSVVPRQQPIVGEVFLNPCPKMTTYKNINVCIQKRASGGDYVTAWKEFILPNGIRRLLLSVRDDYPESTNLEELYILINKYADEEQYKMVEKKHKDWWHDYYTKSLVSIPHPQMESLYWGLQYKLGSMMRKGAPICDLMGPWYKDTKWPGVWMNLNTQMLFSSLHISNQLELVSTLTDYIYDKEDDLINSVPKEYQYNSAGLVRCTGRNQIDPVYTWPNAEYPERSNLIYLMYYMWEHYRITMNDVYLEKQFFPLLKRATNFLINVLEIDNEGVYHTPKAHSPESTDGKDTNYDISSLRWGCMTLLSINERLKLNDPQENTWKNILDNLVDFPVDKNGFMTAVNKPAPLMHRHWCHLFQIYPYYLCNYDNPKDHDVIMRSLKYWGNPDIPNTWTQAVISSMYSSMHMGEEALKHMEIALSTKNLSSNITHSEGGSPCSETYGGLSRMLLDMLIQSWGNKIRIFPGVSKQWKESVFYHLRAEGGFMVSANRKNGATDWIEIESLAGESCVVEHGFAEPFRVIGCKMRKIDNKTVRLFLKKGQKAVLFTKKDNEINVTPIIVEGGTYGFYGWPDRRLEK